MLALTDSQFKADPLPVKGSGQGSFHFAILENALSLWRAGYSLSPAGDGHWQNNHGQFLHRRPTEDEVKAAFANRLCDICVYGGSVSGGFYNLDFDNKTGLHAQVFEDWSRLLQDAVASLLHRLCIIKTKTPGSHRVYWKCKEEPSWFGETVAFDL